MNAEGNIAAAPAMSMPPLPPELADALSTVSGLPKRERTRRQLLGAAVAVIARQGVAGATMQQIADNTGMTVGTVYNHFPNKEAIVDALALWVGQTLCQRIAASYAHIESGAQRMAIGNRRYLRLAQQSPQWALMLLDVVAASPALIQQISADALADLRLGMAQGSFTVTSEAAAMDLISGTITQAMRTIAHGLAPAEHDVAVATTVLRGLGVSWREARAIARRPLPPFPPVRGADATTTSPPPRTRKPRASR